MAASKSPESAESAGEDENKRKFKEALDRKMAKSTGGSEHKSAGGSQPRAHGPVAGRREFRRKSG
jgi:hypothetical protein